MLKLSIITVNLNNAAGLRKTIESVRAQTFKDFEHIIIDGGSSDDSVNVIKEFESDFSYWVSESDGGIYQGMNKGTKIAKGEYCLYLNSGDYLYNGKVLAKVFKEKFNEDIIYGNLILENVKGQRKIQYVLSEKQINIISILSYFIFCHCCTFIKRELLIKQNYYRTDFKNISDTIFFIESFILHNATFKYFPFAISIFCMDGTTCLDFQEINVKEEKKIYRELFGNEIIARKIKDLLYLHEAFNLPFVKTYYKIFSFLKRNIEQIKLFLSIDFRENSMKYLYKKHNRPYYSKMLTFKKINFPKDKKIYLWGMGQNFEKILAFCKKKKLSIQAILDSNQSLQEVSIQGIPIISPQSVISKLDNSVILICTYFYAEQITSECLKAGLVPDLDFFVPFKRLV